MEQWPFTIGPRHDHRAEAFKRTGTVKLRKALSAPTPTPCPRPLWRPCEPKF